MASANVVGYANKAVPANTFVQAGAQFFDVASDTLILDKVMSGLAGVDYDDAAAYTGTAPHIQVVGTDGVPAMYYYLNDGWYDNGTADGDFKAGWCDSAGNIVDLEITPGMGFWLKNAASESQNMIGAGAVSAVDSFDVKAPASVFSINANVYPMSVNFNDATKVAFPDIVGVDYDDAAAYTGTAPHIQVVGTDGVPAMYYYLNDGWYDNGTVDGDFKAGWCDSAGNIVDLVIPVQSGFWVKATTGELTFTYKK